MPTLLSGASPTIIVISLPTGYDETNNLMAKVEDVEPVGVDIASQTARVLLPATFNSAVGAPSSCVSGDGFKGSNGPAPIASVFVIRKQGRLELPRSSVVVAKTFTPVGIPSRKAAIRVP